MCYYKSPIFCKYGTRLKPISELTDHGFGQTIIADFSGKKKATAEKLAERFRKSDIASQFRKHLARLNSLSACLKLATASVQQNQNFEIQIATVQERILSCYRCFGKIL